MLNTSTIFSESLHHSNMSHVSRFSQCSIGPHVLGQLRKLIMNNNKALSIYKDKCFILLNARFQFRKISST